MRGLGAAAAVAERTGPAAGWAVVLHHRRPDLRTAVVRRCGPRRVQAPRGQDGRQAPARSASAAPRARAGAGPRGRVVEHHPAPSRPRQPRHHVDPPPRDRRRGDHHRRAHSAPADDVRQRPAQGLNRPVQRERNTALPLRLGNRAPCARASMQPRLVHSRRRKGHVADARSQAKPEARAQRDMRPSGERRLLVAAPG